VAAVGDHWGHFNVLVVSAAGIAISLLAFWIPLRTLAQLIACAAVYGFFVGGYISIIPACVAQTGPTNEIGIRVGLVWTVVATFALTGPPISGALLSHGGGVDLPNGYRYAGAFSGAVCAIGTILAIWSKKAISGKLVGPA
jgi:MFS family permease